jgi:hypothetical protein
MRLSRLEPYQKFDIRMPIWNNGKRVVGLNENLMKRHNVINILYVRKRDGQRSFPNTLYFNKANLTASHKRQIVGGGVKLVWIPLSELEPLEIETVPTPVPVSTPPKVLNEDDIRKLHPNIYEIFYEKKVRLL